jgi:thymidylate kinase
MPAVAIEGLPGAGKSTLAASLRQRLPGVRIVPELVLEAPPRPDRAFFVSNDRAKEAALAAARGDVVVDRYWPSTVAYAMAEARLQGEAELGAADAIRLLFGTRPRDPDVYLHLDDPACVERSPATDGLWPSRRFRALVREAYAEVFAELDAPHVTVGGYRDRLPASALAAAAAGLLGA